MGGFGDILAARVAERESQIVLGLDPDPEALWPGAHDAPGTPPVEHPQSQRVEQVPATQADRSPTPRTERSPTWRTALATRVHCCALIDATGPACVAVKPQLACFERLGAPGWDALEAVIEHAHQRGLLVIADGKRGDIALSARAYAQALFERLRVDLATVNPLLGGDAIEPFVAGARAAGAGVLLLVRTSNPGAADVQDLELAATDRRAAVPVWERLAEFVAEFGSAGIGESGLSDVGAVVGATQPQHLERARELMPHAVLLLPGVGAQGGRVEDLAPAFAPGRAGGLITASRSIVGAHLATGGDPAEAARAEAERLRETAWSLGA
ncbi:MAG TPA: orotidine-5'-phosphate decarboxylase [Solirubrobacteraceae bacterium]|jgi:orotidine-5'-phosphate decarboxylase|nr:orotidine-5'-phosphate decarboxylase [Solirubrobacteraceae bacterium]